MQRRRTIAIILAGALALGGLVALGGVADAAPGLAASSVDDDFDGDGVPDIAIGNGRTRTLHLHYSTATVDQSHDATLQIPGDGRMYYPFALEPGDYNGDGVDDLAVGEWFRPRGAVFVFHGSSDGLSADPATTLHGRSGPQGSLAYWQFGRVLAAGDVTNDGRDDLAVGLTKKNADDDATQGRVQIFRGSPSGLRTDDPMEVRYGMPEPVAFADIDGDGHADLIAGNENLYAARILVFAGTRHGFAAQPTKIGAGAFPFGRYNNSDLWPKAVGDVNRDGYADVIAASPRIGPHPDQGGNGAIVLLLGGPHGLSDDHSQVIYESQVPTPRPGHEGHNVDQFGYAVAVGRLTGGHYPDVVVGARRQWVAGVKWAGAVYVLHGSAHGLTLADPRRITMRTAGVPGVAQPGAQFGSALSVADFTGDGTDDVVIGAPGPYSGTPEVPVQPGYAIGLAGGSADPFTHHFGQVTGAGPYDQLGVVIA